MGRITIDQSHQVMSALSTNTDWESIDFKEARLQDLVIRNAKEAGQQFAAFLKNGCRMPTNIYIDRTKPFDSKKLLDVDWPIKEEDVQSTVLFKLDSMTIQLKNMLLPREKYIVGEENLKRLKKTSCIRLDAKVFEVFWRNQEMIPGEWKEKIDGLPIVIFFDGTIFEDSDGFLFSICFSWDSNHWSRKLEFLMSNRYSNELSVVLEK